MTVPSAPSRLREIDDDDDEDEDDAAAGMGC